MTVKTIFGGGEKLLIFRQTAPFLFRPDQWSLNPNDPSQDNFSILNRIEEFRWDDDTFHFEMFWPKSPEQDRYEWIQSSNPLNSTQVIGYHAFQVPSENLKKYGGLKRSDTSLLHTELWCCVIGSFEIFQGGIATCNYKSQPQVELYAYTPLDPAVPSDIIFITFGMILFLATCALIFSLWNWISANRQLRVRFLSANTLYEIFASERERHKALMDESDEFETTPHPQMFSPWFSEIETRNLERDVLAYVVDGALTRRLEICESEDSFGGSTISWETRPPTAFQELKKKRQERIRGSNLTYKPMNQLEQVTSSCNSSNSDIVFVEGSFRTQVPLDFPDPATKTGAYFPDMGTHYTDQDLDSAISKYTEHKIRFSRDPGSSTRQFHTLSSTTSEGEQSLNSSLNSLYLDGDTRNQPGSLLRKEMIKRGLYECNSRLEGEESPTRTNFIMPMKRRIQDPPKYMTTPVITSGSQAIPSRHIRPQRPGKFGALTRDSRIYYRKKIPALGSKVGDDVGFMHALVQKLQKDLEKEDTEGDTITRTDTDQISRSRKRRSLAEQIPRPRMKITLEDQISTPTMFYDSDGSSLYTDMDTHDVIKINSYFQTRSLGGSSFPSSYSRSPDRVVAGGEYWEIRL